VGRLERGGRSQAAGDPVGDALVDDLLALVRRARAEGRDAEGALRAGVRVLEDRARAAAGGEGLR
jgi:hypothetical protein